MGEELGVNCGGSVGEGHAQPWHPADALRAANCAALASPHPLRGFGAADAQRWAAAQGLAIIWVVDKS